MPPTDPTQNMPAHQVTACLPLLHHVRRWQQWDLHAWAACQLQHRTEITDSPELVLCQPFSDVLHSLPYIAQQEMLGNLRWGRMKAIAILLK